jgi:hypothetical protein
MAHEEVTITGLEWVRGKEEPLESFGRLDVRSWEDDALTDRDTFVSNLRLLGMSDKSVIEALDIRDAGAQELAEGAKKLEPYRGVAFAVSPPEYIEAQRVYYSAHKSALERLGDWWNKRVTITETIEPVTVDIPLFVLGTPVAPGCKAEWTTQSEYLAAGTWSLQILGTGLGSSVDDGYIRSASFEASSGETKLIYCPVAVQLERLAITEPGKPTTRQWRIDVAGLSLNRPLPGLRLLDPDAVPGRGIFVERYPLATDPTGAIATYKHEYKQTVARTSSVGINVRGVQLGLSVTSKCTSSVEIKYTLKTGLNYDLFAAEGSEGLLFGTANA